jgi:thioredoxin-like negative regulator of GroEL
MQSPSPADRRDLAAVQLVVVRKLAEVAPAVDLQRDEAACLVLLERGEEARKLLTTLDRQLGRDPDFIQAYAAALQQFATPDDLSKAADLWRRLERLSKPGSEAWFEAKYQLAGVLAKSGDKERALKVLRVTSELWLNDPTADIQPALREKNRQRFSALEKEIGR